MQVGKLGENIMTNLETLQDLVKQERFDFINDFEVHKVNNDSRFKLVSDKYWFSVGGYHAYVYECFFEVKDGKVGYTTSKREKLQVKTEHGYKIEYGELKSEFIPQYSSIKEAVESFAQNRATDYIRINESFFREKNKNLYSKEVLDKAKAFLSEK